MGMIYDSSTQKSDDWSDGQMASDGAPLTTGTPSICPGYFLDPATTTTTLRITTTMMTTMTTMKWGIKTCGWLPSGVWHPRARDESRRQDNPCWSTPRGSTSETSLDNIFIRFKILSWWGGALRMILTQLGSKLVLNDPEAMMTKMTEKCY